MPSPSTVSNADQLEVLGLDARARAALSRARPLVEEALPGALDDLYDQLRRTPSVRGQFADEGQMQRTRSADALRWSRLASGAADEVKSQGGAEAEWQVSAQGRVLETLVRHLIVRGAKSRGPFGGFDAGALADTVAP